MTSACTGDIAWPDRPIISAWEARRHLFPVTHRVQSLEAPSTLDPLTRFPVPLLLGPQAVAAETGASAPEIRAVARAGIWLADFPVFARAFADGVLSLRHIRELKRLDKPRTHDGLLLAQDELLGAARDHDFVEFTHRVATWAINHDPDGDDVKDQVEATSCSMTTHTDGSITGRFRLDPLSAAAVGSALENEVQRLHNQ